MTKDRIPSSGTALSVLSTLAPIVSGVFVAYLVIGLALPVIPLHVHEGLGLGAFVVGLVAGAQFTASLFSRFWSGDYADGRGGKRSMEVGLLVAFAAGLLYLLSLRFTHLPGISVAILMVGGAILGAGESFIVSGALVWGLALAGPQNTGKVMAWVGTAMYIAFAAGAPAGTALYAKFGFTAIALATAFIPLVNLLLIMRSPAIPPAKRVRPSSPGYRCSMATRPRPGVQQPGFRRHHDVHYTVVQPPGMASGMGRIDLIRNSLRVGAADFRSSGGSLRRRPDRADLRAH